MLVLTRRAGESIVIGNDVVVTVVEVRGDQVRLGIDAPRSVAVHREEVYRAVERENAAAVAAAEQTRAVLRRQAPGVPPRAPRPGKALGGPGDRPARRSTPPRQP